MQFYVKRTDEMITRLPTNYQQKSRSFSLVCQAQFEILTLKFCLNIVRACVCAYAGRREEREEGGVVRECVRACVRACMRACVCVCLCACARFGCVCVCGGGEGRWGGGGGGVAKGKRKGLGTASRRTQRPFAVRLKTGTAGSIPATPSIKTGS